MNQWHIAPMRLFLLTFLTMVAFAANSILNRMALVDQAADPVVFGAIRVLSGAIVLAVLVLWQRKSWRCFRPASYGGALWLLLYIYGFSLAYTALDAGAGALILFGTVQITMFSGAVLRRESIPSMRWLGAAVAMSGLAWLFWPSQTGGLNLMAALFMVIAGIGWGGYSLAGQKTADPLLATAQNFLLAAPFGVLWVLLQGDGLAGLGGTHGLFLAIMSGAVTSGMGYALWYRIIPMLGASRAAVSQLSVPVIALAAGAVLLQEPVGGRVIVAALLVLGGIAVSLLRPKS